MLTDPFMAHDVRRLKAAAAEIQDKEASFRASRALNPAQTHAPDARTDARYAVSHRRGAPLVAGPAGDSCFVTEKTKDGDLKHEIALACPYGVGDRLWAKEAHVLEHCVETGQLPPHDDGRPLPTRPEGDGDSPAWIQLHYRTTDAVPPSPTPTWTHPAAARGRLVDRRSNGRPGAACAHPGRGLPTLLEPDQRARHLRDATAPPAICAGRPRWWISNADAGWRDSTAPTTSRSSPSVRPRSPCEERRTGTSIRLTTKTLQ